MRSGGFELAARAKTVLAARPLQQRRLPELEWLEPDLGERSETHLRAILSINRFTSPDENPRAPSARSELPQEVFTTLDPLYASLLISLSAAFVAMLGEQWLNRYLRHTANETWTEEGY